MGPKCVSYHTFTTRWSGTHTCGETGLNPVDPEINGWLPLTGNCQLYWLEVVSIMGKLKLLDIGCVGKREKTRRKHVDVNKRVMCVCSLHANKQSPLATTMTSTQHTDFLTAVRDVNLDTLITSGNLQLLQALKELAQLQ